MIAPQFDHIAKGSFLLWLDNFVLKKGRGYSVVETDLVPVPSETLAHFDVFRSRHSQWVYDGSIEGMEFPTIIPSAGSPGGDIPDSPSSAEESTRDLGARIDFNNGRVLVPKTVFCNTVSARYTAKDICIIPTTVPEGPLLFETKFKLSSLIKTWEPSKEVEHVYPAIFVTYRVGANEPFCFSGEDKTMMRFRLILVMDTVYNFDAVAGILRDSVRTCIPLATPALLPFDSMGDLKDIDSGFDFKTYGDSCGTNLLTIERVSVSPLAETLNLQIGKNIKAGFVDLDISAYRYPRA